MPDPHSSPQSEREDIINECKNNIWYFLREVVRIPQPNGGSSRFELNPANMATIFLLLKGVNIYELGCRQTSHKTITTLLYMVWKENLIIFDKSHSIKHHESMIINIYRYLPSYIKDSQMPRLFINPKDKPLYWYDEAETIGKDLNQLELSHISEETKENQIIITTTVGKEENIALSNIRNKCKPFFLKWYDATDNGVFPDWVLLEFNADALGKTEQWKDDIFRYLNTDRESYNREILLIREGE